MKFCPDMTDMINDINNTETLVQHISSETALSAVLYHILKEGRKEQKIAHTVSYNGGSFLSCDDFGRLYDHSFPACAFFSFCFFEVEISSRTLIPLVMLGSVHSGSASCDETTVAECSLTSCL